MDTSSFVGSAVSIEVLQGDVVFQGKIIHVDPVEHSITITSAIKNGLQCREKEVTIRSVDSVCRNFCEFSAW